MLLLLLLLLLLLYLIVIPFKVLTRDKGSIILKGNEPVFYKLSFNLTSTSISHRRVAQLAWLVSYIAVLCY